MTTLPIRAPIVPSLAGLARVISFFNIAIEVFAEAQQQAAEALFGSQIIYTQSSGATYQVDALTLNNRPGVQPCACGPKHQLHSESWGLPDRRNSGL